MKYLFDTDTFSVLARSGNRALSARVAGCEVNELALSAITIGEIEFGLAKKPLGVVATRQIERYRSTFAVLLIDESVAVRYGPLRAHLRRLGTPIGPNDLWIAAQALAHDLTLVTGNDREFARVPTLKVENWMR